MKSVNARDCGPPLGSWDVSKKTTRQSRHHMSCDLSGFKSIISSISDVVCHLLSGVAIWLRWSFQLNGSVECAWYLVHFRNWHPDCWQSRLEIDYLSVPCVSELSVYWPSYTPITPVETCRLQTNCLNLGVHCTGNDRLYHTDTTYLTLFIMVVYISVSHIKLPITIFRHYFVSQLTWWLLHINLWTNKNILNQH